MMKTLLPLALILAPAVGCGDDSAPAPQRSETEHNAADVTFASEMLQHHARALSMVDLTLDRPIDPEVRELAEQVRAARAPEIQTFSEWLTDWDEPIPETMRDHVNAGHGDEHVGESMEGVDTDMPGMMSADEMTALSEASDGEFRAMWLDMMIEHHEGAVEMAQAEIEDGRYQPAVNLAGDIVDTQSAEIETMQALSTS
ncbi:DUF305 domain-containing protein [Nocardioides sp. B-3]|uniref:DUF305 domain-containing protein n=1 Tax=Nocardioides sp. B-3 TaxID=2895565 RepID=UPI00215377A6|nr:DUF305 domain-containing protein [Nocardioides sp. B-3]UUZ60072.1 DUF305 domain-containing protein [Nocardioides sp. B-3]